jgi:hypothetical protein
MSAFRIDPQAGPEHFKTYAIVAPLATHWRTATCREVECAGWKNGFRSAIDVSTDLGARQASYIENQSGRRFTRTHDGTVVTYDFPAGQACFRAHKVPLERTPIYVVRDGDYRGNPRGTEPARRTADEWVDDFANHQQRIADAYEKG